MNISSPPNNREVADEPSEAAPIRHRSARNNILFAFGVALALVLAWQVRSVLLTVYVSALFAVVLTPVIRWIMGIKLGKWKISQVQAILLLLLGVVGGLTLFGIFALPPVVHDLQQFTRELPARMPVLIERTHHIPFIQHVDVDTLAKKLEDVASSFATYIFMSIGNWAGKFLDVITGVVLTIYFMLEGDEAYLWTLSFFPPLPRQRLDQTLRRAKLRMGKWLLAQGALMVILGISSTVVFLALHIRYAYALGVLMGLFNIVPVAGAMVSMAFVLLVAGIDSWGRMAGALIFYFFWVQLENSYLIPKVMKSSVDLAGLAVLIALLLGASIAGIAGALVSVPTAVLVAVLIDEYLVNREAVPVSPSLGG